MRLRLFTPPSELPLTLAEAKAHLRETESDQDTQIEAFLKGAVSQLDGRDGVLGRALCTQTWDMLLDAFPAGDAIEIPLPPLQSVTSVTYVDQDGATQTMPSADYIVDTASQPGVIVLAYGKSWPYARAQRNAVTIRFIAGYGAAAAVPPAIKDAIKLMVGDRHKDREGAGFNAAADNLLFQFKVLRP